MSDVKVGDLLRDETLLEVGMLCQWPGDQLSWVHGPGVWTFDKPGGASAVETAVRTRGVRILALPPKAEVAPALAPKCKCQPDYDECDVCTPGAHAPKCAPDCTPAQPCWTIDDSRDEHFYCPAFRERSIDTKMREDFHASGLVPEGLYEPRPTRFLPLQHAANGGFAIWGRR